MSRPRWYDRVDWPLVAFAVGALCLLAWTLLDASSAPFPMRGM